MTHLKIFPIMFLAFSGLLVIAGSGPEGESPKEKIVSTPIVPRRIGRPPVEQVAQRLGKMGDEMSESKSAQIIQLTHSFCTKDKDPQQGKNEASQCQKWLELRADIVGERINISQSRCFQVINDIGSCMLLTKGLLTYSTK